MIEFPRFKDYKNQRIKFIQPKLDGHLVKIYRHGNKLTILTKNDKDITRKIFDINPLVDNINLTYPNSIMFGELHCPNIRATSIPTLLNNRDERLMITVFAAPLFNRVNLFNTNLIEVMNRLNHYGIRTPPTSILEPERSISERCCRILLEDAAKRKLEGWVLKQEHMKGWFKLKPTKTVDAFVIGTAKSFSTTHYGGLQSIQVAVFNDWRVHDLGSVGSGFELEYRKTVDRASLIDRVAEVEYDSLAANGKLRFPRFVRWRNDKDKKQCTFDQVGGSHD